MNSGSTASATINAGATLGGTTSGLNATATNGTTITNNGTIGSSNNLAITLAGGFGSLSNNATGVINGYLTLNGSNTQFNNGGIWNAAGADSTFNGSSSTINNTGTINVFPAGTTAATMHFNGLKTLYNTGTINLNNGHTGDILDLTGVTYVGGAPISVAAISGAGTPFVTLEANLGNTTIAGAAPQTSDLLIVGAASGVTTIVVKDLGNTQPGQYNFTGIQVVQTASATPGAFVLSVPSIDKGLVQYKLVQNAAGQVYLVSVPSTSSFETGRTGAEAQKYWRQSGDSWSAQMTSSTVKHGLSVWGQVYTNSETDKSDPKYSATVLLNNLVFTPNLELKNSATGMQAGFEWGQSQSAFGITAGYVEQTGRATATGSRIKLTGGNVGLYARYETANGLYVRALAKVDRYSVKYALASPAVIPSFNGTSYGVQLDAGYHYQSGKMFIEPRASISYTHSDLNNFADSTGTFTGKFANTDSAFGSVGLRAGYESKSANWTIKPYVGAAWAGELNGQSNVTLTSGGTAQQFVDAPEGGHAKLEAGLEGTSAKGVTLFGKVEGVVGKNANGVGGRAGVAVRW